MLRQRARAFMSYFKQKRSRTRQNQFDNVDNASTAGKYLNMETFLSQDHASINSEFLQDSSDTDDENETVFAMNKKTGEWRSFDSDNDETEENSNSFQNWIWKIGEKIHSKKKSTHNNSAKEFDDDFWNGNGSSESDNLDSDTPLIAV